MAKRSGGATRTSPRSSGSSNRKRCSAAVSARTTGPCRSSCCAPKSLSPNFKHALAGADQKCEALNHDKRALWHAAEQARDEAERLGRRLAEGESALSATRADLGRVEAGYADVCGERNRLAEIVQELREQHKTECHTLNGRIEVLQSRATATERLVAETRQRLIERTEEARAFICKAAEATIARGSAERRLAEIEAAQGLRRAAAPTSPPNRARRCPSICGRSTCDRARWRCRARPRS